MIILAHRWPYDYYKEQLRLTVAIISGNFHFTLESTFRTTIMKANPRIAAITTLYELDKTRLPLPVIFERIERQLDLGPKDRQLANKIVYGVLRNRDYLDRLLELLCRQPLNKLKPFIHQALRSGLFQIFFLDRIPPSAAVNETVKAVSSKRYPSRVQGFVNGVLRESIRRQPHLPGPEEPNDAGRPVLNHPAWLTDRWQKQYGRDEMIKICRHNNLEPLLCLRTGSGGQQARLSETLISQGFEVVNGSYAPDSLILPEYRGKINDIEGIDQGTVQVQDQASQLASLLLAPFTPGLSCLDGCAGLGGKTTHLMSLLDSGTSKVTAIEPEQSRYRLLEQNLQNRHHHCRVVTRNQSLQDFAGSGPWTFDRLLIDAPCSGTGVIGRHPDIRWNRREEELSVYRTRQLELLNLSAQLLETGGILVYATCSIEPEENASVIEQFLTTNTDFTRTDCGEVLPPSCKNLIRNGYFAPLPDWGIDGFFCARLSKNR